MPQGSRYMLKTYTTRCVNPEDDFGNAGYSAWVHGLPSQLPKVMKFPKPVLFLLPLCVAKFMTVHY